MKKLVSLLLALALLLTAAVCVAEGSEAAAIGSPDNCVLLVTPESAEAFGPASKREVALKIVSRIASMLNSQTSLIQNHAD